VETAARVFILLTIGAMAGAAAFRHVHDLSVTHGQPDWIGWANAVAIELMAMYLGLEIRARLRVARPVGLVAVLLVAFACLSLAAQVAEAERSVWGWIVAAVPSMAFLALVKVVLSGAPAVTGERAPALVVPPAPDAVPDAAERAPEPAIERAPEPGPERAPVAVPPAALRAPSPVLPPLGIVHPNRINATAVTR
jgi:hypothetical protein